jgi:flagella basal body P-ring formation protein FlgA
VSKRALREGEVVTRNDLKEAALVKRGDVVTLLARGSGFTVSALGEARDGGSKGDAVLVENLDSKQLVHATVIGHKTVEVVVAGGVR